MGGGAAGGVVGAVPAELVAGHGGGVAGGAIVDGQGEGDRAVAAGGIGEEVGGGGGGGVVGAVPAEHVASHGGGVAGAAVVDSEIQRGDGYMEGVDHHGVGIGACGGALDAAEEEWAVAQLVCEGYTQGVDALVEVIVGVGGNEAVGAGAIMDALPQHGNFCGVVVVVALGGGDDGVIYICFRARVDCQMQLIATHQAAAGAEDTVVEVVCAGGSDGVAIPDVGQAGLADIITMYTVSHSPFHLQVQHGDAVAERHADGVVVGARPKKITPTEVVDSTRTNGVVEDGADGVGRLVEVVPCDGGNQAVGAWTIVIDRLHGNHGGVAVVVALGGGADGVVDISMRARMDSQAQALAGHVAASRREGVVAQQVVAGLRNRRVVPAVGQLVVADLQVGEGEVGNALHFEVQHGDAVVGGQVDGVVVQVRPGTGKANACNSRAK